MILEGPTMSQTALYNKALGPKYQQGQGSETLIYIMASRILSVGLYNMKGLYI